RRQKLRRAVDLHAPHLTAEPCAVTSDDDQIAAERAGAIDIHAAAQQIGRPNRRGQLNPAAARDARERVARIIRRRAIERAVLTDANDLAALAGARENVANRELLTRRRA